MRQSKPSPELRGYGRRHRVTRAVLAPFVAAGMTTCSRCLKRILPGEAWDLDHSADRASYLGASHSRCNRSAGARVRNRGPSREWVR